MTDQNADGIVTDPLRVYGALLPKAKVATIPRAFVRLADTILVADGVVWKWLSTSPAGEVVEKVHADLESIHSSFMQSALAVGSNTGRLMMLVRRVTGAVELLTVEQSVEFFRRWDEEAHTVVALQVRGRSHPQRAVGSAWSLCIVFLAYDVIMAA